MLKHSASADVLTQALTGENAQVKPISEGIDAEDQLVLVDGPMRSDTHPALLYLDGLAGPSRGSQEKVLEEMARQLTRGAHTMHSLPWERLRYQHTAALRSWLGERFPPWEAAPYLSALRRAQHSGRHGVSAWSTLSHTIGPL